jgi:hypothetical protein
MLALQALRSRTRDRDRDHNIRNSVINVIWAEAWDDTDDAPDGPARDCGQVPASGPGGGVAAAIALGCEAAGELGRLGIPGRIYLTDGLGSQLDVSRAWDR